MGNNGMNNFKVEKKIKTKQIEALGSLWSGGAPEVEKAANVKPKYKPYLSLPAEKLQELNKLIFEDNKITQVVKILKEDLGLYKTTKPETLRLYLQEYKKDFKEVWVQFHMGKTLHVTQSLPEELKEHVPTSVADVKLAQWIPYGRVRVLLQEALTKYDAMTELERVTLMQYERVLKVWEYEQKLPSERVDDKGVVTPLLQLCDEGGREIQLLHTMLGKIVTLQMDLGIRHKEEKNTQHLHIEFQKSHQDLMNRFSKSKKFTSLTAEALDIITNDLPNEDDQEPSDLNNHRLVSEVPSKPHHAEQHIHVHVDENVEVDITASFNPDELD